MTIVTNIDHQRIVALNNLGVNLLERKHFLKAKQHFRDILDVLKSSLGSQDQKLQDMTEEKLHEVLLLLPIKDEARPTIERFQRGSIVTLRNDLNFSYMKQLLEKGPNAMLGATMRISEAQCNCCEDSHSFDIECAIILYNLGLACYFQHRQENQAPHLSAPLQSCCRLLELTVNALSPRPECDCFQLCNLLFIRTIVVANHWHVLLEAGDTEGAAIMAALFQENRTATLSFINKLPCSHCPQGASAA